MEKHISLVGILNIVYESLSIIGAFVLFFIAMGFKYFFGFISRYSHHGMDDVPPEVLDIVPFILTVIGIFLLIFSIIGLIAAIGVLKKKEWGRITMLVMSFFNLIRIPLGTILGVYTIWALLNDETIRLFNPITQAPVKKTTISS
jgi:ABC-type uncharacterized transport system permease subunit